MRDSLFQVRAYVNRVESASKSSPSKFDPKVIAAKPWKARPGLPATFSQNNNEQERKPQFYFGQQVAVVAKAAVVANKVEREGKVNGSADMG